MIRRLVLLLLIIFAAGELVGPNAEVLGASARELLTELSVKAETEFPYERNSQFGNFLTGNDDRCSTRIEVLLQERISGKTFGKDSCQVAGIWNSPYDDRTTWDASDLEIDHQVPLKEAWDSGATEWSDVRRQAFMNDLAFWGSLTAVSNSVNESKRADEPGQWMPPNSDFRCRYLALWVAVKWRWDLSVDESELVVLTDQLKQCSDKSLMVPDLEKATKTPTGQTEPNLNPNSSIDSRFKSCEEVLEAGLGPYSKEDPEYSWYTDGDADGIVCDR
jgi:hypothetical protein